MSKNQVIGQARVKIDGDLLETTGDSTLDLGGTSREAVEGDYSVGDFREKTMPSKLECNVKVKGETNFAGTDVRNATISIEFDTGQTFMIRGGYRAEPPSINQSDSKAKLSFQGQPAEQV